MDAYLSRYDGYYLTADAGYIDDDGYVYVMSRTDDVINTAGHRLSTGAIEEVLAAHPDVAECAVVGVADDLKGQVPIGLAVLKAGVEREHSEIAAELVARVREEIGPVASLKQVRVVRALPKTRSGKILRGTIRKIADGDKWRIPATIEDPTVLDDLGDVLADMGASHRPPPGPDDRGSQSCEPVEGARLVWPPMGPLSPRRRWLSRRLRLRVHHSHVLPDGRRADSG